MSEYQHGEQTSRWGGSAGTPEDQRPSEACLPEQVDLTGGAGCPAWNCWTDSGRMVSAEQGPGRALTFTLTKRSSFSASVDAPERSRCIEK